MGATLLLARTVTRVTDAAEPRTRSRRAVSALQALVLRRARPPRDRRRAMHDQLAEISASLQGLTHRLDEMSHRTQALTAMATRDPLTGLYNRMSTSDTLKRLAATMTRDEVVFAVALVDLDRFKNVNDRHGHATGDQVLQAAAAAIGAGVRAGDPAARWGGEEFLLLLLGADATAAALVCERIRDAVAASCRDLPESVTASVGVIASSEVPVSGPDAVEWMLSAADARLYAAKSAGRNRVWSTDPD